MKIGALFSMLIAVAMLFAPAASAAHFMAASGHQNAQTMAMGHCQSLPTDTQGKAPAKSCCIAMCMAVAVAPAQPVKTALKVAAPTYFAAPQYWRGFLGELATPPPRIA